MSAIQSLRNKSGLITIVIGVALLSFVVTGLDPSLFSDASQENVIAEVNNTEYPYEAYYQILERFQENENANQNSFQRERTYDAAWNAFINKAIFDEMYVELGLGTYNPWLNIVGLPEEEAKDVIIGEHIDPELQYYFQNPETGQFDKEMLVQTLSRLNEFKETNPEFYIGWIAFEKGIHEKTLQSKYNALVSKGLYPTSLDVEMRLNELKTSSDVEFVKIPYNSVADSTIEVADKEIKAYYDKNKSKEEYQQEASVTFEYVTFDIVPTAEDIKATETFVAEKAEAFKNATNEASFLSINSSIPYSGNYFAKGQLPAKIDSFAFASKVNDVTNVYLENNVYKVAKVSDIRSAADSAKVRHILLNGQNAVAEADSLKNLIEKGASFVELAKKHSADSGSAINGGLIDWFTEGQMVKSFQDSSFFGKKGELYIAPSQFGLHIIQILEQGPKSKRVQVEYLAKEITYSNDTRKDIYKNAVVFASENQTKESFDNSIETNKAITKRFAENTLENQRIIPGLEDSRDIIRWAHQNKEEIGKISEIFTCGDKYVIAAISKVNEKGAKALTDVQEDIRTIILEEKQAKQIVEKAKQIANPSLQTYASEFKSLVKNSSQVAFGNQSAVEIGMEPNVIATASVLEAGKISEPIVGESGVYFLVVNKRTENEISADAIESQLSRNYSRTVVDNVFNFMKGKSEIVDNRIFFQ